MYKICIFGGTTEGRRLAEFLSIQPISVTACVATEYGEALMPESDNLTLSSRRLTENEIIELLKERRFDLVIDATHPYADSVTKSIIKGCEIAQTEYIRLQREASELSDDAVFIRDIAAAVEFLNGTKGNVLLTTGSKELLKYKPLRDFSERVYVRVLPMAASLDVCHAAGVRPSHIIAMQGPFSEEMNEAVLRYASARWMVTKDSGEAGGFDTKLSAARKAGAKLVVIGRPAQPNGLSFSETVNLLCERFGCVRIPDVCVVGIGPGSRDAITAEALHAVENAECLIGAKRMLEAVSCPGQFTFDAISPKDIADFIKAHCEYQRFTVVMSGDVGFYSGAKKLLPLLSDCSVRVFPGLSSLSCLCARLKTSYEDVVSVSLHGRENNIIPEIRVNARVFALLGGENGANCLCKKLIDCDLGHVRLSIGERLGYPDERITQGSAEELVNSRFDSLSAALIENEHPDALVTHGLPDCCFKRSMDCDEIVPMTKSEIRSVCLSKLMLTERAVCFDIGAGTGSVAVEMAIKAKKGHVFAIEKRQTAQNLLTENRDRFCARNMTVVHGCAPEACIDLPTPTHAFIGGSSGNMKEIIKLLLAKNPNIRIVATAVSLESAGELTECMKAFSFKETEVVCVSVAKDKKAGSYHLMTGQNPVYIFTMQYGGGD